MASLFWRLVSGLFRYIAITLYDTDDYVPSLNGSRLQSQWPGYKKKSVPRVHASKLPISDFFYINANFVY